MEEGRGECIFEVGLGSEPPGSNESCDAEDSEQASGKTDSIGINFEVWYIHLVFYLLLGLVAADYDASVATLESIALSLGNELKTQISFISGFSF